MMKNVFLFMVVMGLAGVVGTAHAEELKIKNYYFVWYAASAGDAHMDIEKSQDGLKVVLRSPGGKLATIYPTPDEAIAIGKTLKETGIYYDKQMEKEDYKAEDLVVVGRYKVYFRSSRGQNFEVSVRAPGVISAAVVMSKNDALKIADRLLRAEEMAKLVNERIQP